MTELRHYHSTLTIEVQAVGEVAPVVCRFHAPGTRIAPTFLKVTYWVHKYEGWSVHRVELRGAKLKKDGTPGQVWVETSVDSDEYPEWVQDFVDYNFPGETMKATK